jgi:SAM-dependent methyltransferase
MSGVDDVVNYWNSSPCNINHSYKEIGTREYFDEVERKKFFVEPHIPKFADYSNWKNKKVLEIGCGIGTDAINFAKHGAKYVGLELSNKSLDLTKKRFDAYGQDGSFYCGNSENLTHIVPVENYDLIYSFGVIHHTPNPEMVISEIKRYMTKTSVLKIMLYAKNSWKNYMIDAGLDQPEAQFGCPIANTYTKNGVQTLLNGFDILSIDQTHIFPYIIKDYKKGLYNKLPWFEVMTDDVFGALESSLGWHLLITAKLSENNYD